MENEKSAGFTEHDLERRRLTHQVLVLEHLVLTLFVALAKKKATETDTADEPGSIHGLARALVQKSLASLRGIQPDGPFQSAELAMLQDESLEVFSAIDQHLEFILSGDL
jgi:hypothetical protein